MSLCRATFGSSEHEECLEFRRVLLREPLGLGWSEEDLAEEESEWQMCWREDGELVGCVSIRWLGEGVVKLRQMAVRTERQGEGVGRRLLAAVLGLLREKEVREVRLHAREAVVEFYEKLGFECFGERFEEVGIAHRAMKRQI